jgi:murein L,D-transpeptidase YafK
MWLVGTAAIVMHRVRFQRLGDGLVADKVLVDKAARRLTLLHEGRQLKSYSIALGSEPEGKKRFEGDGKTPEGTYTIDGRNSASRYHLALHISYPDTTDAAYARRAGEEPGGDIMIHGLPNGLGFIGPLHRLRDWTQGCVAVTNAEIEEIWRAVPDRVPVEIRP